MALVGYGLLKGRAVRAVPGRGKNGHYSIHVIDDNTDWRIAVNVLSQLAPHEVEYVVDEDFRHPLATRWVNAPLGFRELASDPEAGGLDFIRGNLFDRSLARPLPPDVLGPDNDLNDKVDRYVSRAIAEEDALLYVFGQRWGPEQKKDKVFGFMPGNGVHDIHMNQGNTGDYVKDDGVWQDGGLLFQFPSTGQWVGVFLKFQSQTWHTEDRTGHRIEPTGIVAPVVDHSTINGPGRINSEEPDFAVRIVAAMVNPAGPAPERETVTLLNTTAAALNLGGWLIANAAKSKFALTGTIKAGEAQTFILPASVPLSNKGGLITLLNPQGLKVHGVSYTAEQARHEGKTIVF